MKILTLFLFCFFAATMQASVPKLVTLQGNVLDQNSKPVTGTHVMKLKLYDALTGGNLVFSEIQSVTFENGLYNVTMGTETPLPDSLIFDRQYFLGIIIDN